MIGDTGTHQGGVVRIRLTERQEPSATGPTLARRLIRWTFRITCLLALVLFAIHGYVYWGASSRIHTVGDAPVRQAILVLGASVWRDGQPSPMLEDRLRAALELYRAGKAGKVLVSGDHGRKDYDEVRVMAGYLEQRGVPAADIFLDHAGFRTLDSMYRARTVFGLDSVLVVSNPFHVPRAVFLGQCAGLQVDGVAADYGVPYSWETRWRNAGREIFARILAFADVYLMGTRPRYPGPQTGPQIDIRGDGRVTRDG